MKRICSQVRVGSGTLTILNELVLTTVLSFLVERLVRKNSDF
jgi:hypothetical protein